MPKFISKPTDSEGNTLATEKYVDGSIGDMESEIIKSDDIDSEGRCQLYKTVNGKRVNIEPKVGGGSGNSSPYIYMTQAEYEALDTYQPGKMYWVTYPVTGCYLVWKDGVCIDGDGKDRIGGVKYTNSGNYTHYQKCPYRNLAIAFNPCNDGDAQISVYDYLENLDIAKNVTNIGKYAFYKSTNFKKIKMSNVSSIGDYAFQDCSALTNADLGDGVTSIGSSAFSGCKSLESITIPASVTSIGNNAFVNCSSLASVTLPIGAGITFGNYVFNGCSNFKSIIFLSSPNNNSITSSDIAYFKENYSSYIVNVSLPDGLLSIGGSAFYGCSSLTSITIPDSVTSIGSYAFSNCSSLTSIIIPDGVTSIENRTFYGCKSLVSVTIPDSVTSIGSEAFSGCSSLANVYISDIESWFNIQFDSYMSTPLNCGGNLYINNDLATEIIIPNSITSIGSYAFYGCKSLVSVKIPDSVTSIGFWAFNDCSNLTSITIPNSVISIGNSAFSGCSNLTSITIPDSVTSIEYGTFANCKSLTSIIIPDGVTSIGNVMFYYCTSLKNITIPDSVTSIGERAFLSCYVLSDIYYTGTQSQWNAITKGDSWNNGMGSSVSGGTKIHYNYVPK